MMANGGEASGHFYKKDQANAAEHNCPEQLKAELPTGLSSRRYRSDFQETAHACDYSECDFKDFFHLGISILQLFVAIAR